MRVLWILWALCTGFGLPIKLLPKMRAAWRTPDQPVGWRLGRVMFFGGILIWSPAALLRKLLEIPVSIKPFLIIHFVLLYGGLLVQRLSRKREAPAVLEGATGA